MRPYKMNVKQHSIITYPDLGFNYIAIPKTASSSFKTACWVAQGIVSEEDFKIDNWFKKPKKYLKYISPNDALENDLITITTFRNPINRTISLFKDFLYGYKKDENPSGSKQFRQDFSNAKERQDLEYFIDFFTSHPEEDRNIHFRSQSWFVNFILTDPNTFFFTSENYDSGIEKLKLRGFNLKSYYINKNLSKKEFDITTTVKNKILKTHETDYELWRSNNV